MGLAASSERADLWRPQCAHSRVGLLATSRGALGRCPSLRSSSKDWLRGILTRSWSSHASMTLIESYLHKATSYHPPYGNFVSLLSTGHTPSFLVDPPGVGRGCVPASSLSQLTPQAAGTTLCSLRARALPLSCAALRCTPCASTPCVSTAARHVQAHRVQAAAGTPCASSCGPMPAPAPTPAPAPMCQLSPLASTTVRHSPLPAPLPLHPPSRPLVPHCPPEPGKLCHARDARAVAARAVHAGHHVCARGAVVEHGPRRVDAPAAHDAGVSRWAAARLLPPPPRLQPPLLLMMMLISCCFNHTCIASMTP